ncbi:MAG: DUF2807 domain-containing protein [Massilia sp.]|nr:DUF2807 domain-containing protein [Massilia sp.]
MTPSRLRARTLGAAILLLTAVVSVIAAAPSLARGGSSERVQGSGTVKLETRAPGHFSGVALSLPAQLALRIGSTESVTIETDANLLPLIETVVENGTLHIRAARRNVNIDTRHLTIVVQARAIDKLALGGSGTIEADALRANKVSIDLGGSGAINVKRVDSEVLVIHVGGSGKLNVGAGAAKTVTLSLAGSGDVDLGKLQSVDASVNLAGSGDATLAVREHLNVAIVGSGNVNYHGDPTLSKTVIGSGRTRQVGAAPR